MDAVPPDTTTTNSHRHGLAWGCATVAATAWMMLAAPPASADEFAVGIVVESSASDSDISAFMKGFQLAVDQSPDVSHPPGVEGGDHLGSMDVVMITIGGDLEGDELLGAAIELMEADRVPIVAVDATADILDPLVDVAVASRTMLIVLSDVGGESTNSQLVFYAADRQRTERLLTDRALTFADAFFANFGRPPSPAATRGYIAGRLVDISVEATGRDPSDTSTLASALANATATEGDSSSSVAGTQAPARPPGSASGDIAPPTSPEAQGEATQSDTERRNAPALVLAVGAVVTIVAWLAQKRFRRRGS